MRASLEGKQQFSSPVAGGAAGRWRILLWCLLVLVASGSLLATSRSVLAIERGPLNAALLATARVAVPVAGEDDTYSIGSGTIMSADGYILTNYHVMGDIEQRQPYNREALAFIAVNPTSLKGEPIWKYAATMVEGDPDLDLAVLKIVGLMEDENAPLPSNLGLTPAQIGDSDVLEIGDEINIFGFPSIGGATVTFTSGNVSGFLDEDQDRVFEFIKTDAEVNRGNSGGLATDAQGRFIGVPTAGRTDVEAAGKISLVRSGNLALPILKVAMTQLDPQDRNRTGVDISGNARVDNVRFAQAIDRQGRPLDPAVRFAGSVDVVYGTFDFDGFQNGQRFGFTWFQDGFQLYQDNLSWDLGSRGASWVNLYADGGLEAGYYELELVLDGAPLFRDGFMVGQAGPSDRQISLQSGFGPITFAEDVTSSDEPIGPGAMFSDVEAIYAFFDVVDVRNGTTWSRRWYLDGELAAEKEEVWNGGTAANWWVSVSSQGGMPVGAYRLDLLIEKQVVQSGEFSIVDDGGVVAPANQVLIVGTITEADNTRRTVSGAKVFFLQPGVRTAQFLDQLKDEQVYAVGITDADGYYQLDQMITPGEYHGVVVFHNDYKLVTADDYQISPDATSPWEVNVTMERR